MKRSRKTKTKVSAAVKTVNPRRVYATGEDGLAQEDVCRLLMEAAESLDKVFRQGHGRLPMDVYATDILTLTTFIKNGNWQFKE